jgi:hypothetical protein
MLATPEDLAALLQDDELDRSTAELLLQCATSHVQSAAGQRILEVENDEITLYLDSFDSDTWLSLPERPVTAVSAVSIGATPVADWSAQLNRSRLYRAYGWRSTLIAYPDAPSTVTVTYTHGYPDGHQKLQLARSATLALAAQGASNPTGALREQIDDYSVQYADAYARMQPSAEMVLALRNLYGRATKSVRLVRSWNG